MLDLAQHEIRLRSNLSGAIDDRSPMFANVAQADGGEFSGKGGTFLTQLLKISAGAGAKAFPIFRGAWNAFPEYFDKAARAFRQVLLKKLRKKRARDARIKADLKHSGFRGVGADVAGRSVAAFAISARAFTHTEPNEQNE